MEKYGVVEKEESESGKTASDSGQKTCPVCGLPLSDVAQTGVRFCKKCGTKPFEEK